MVAKASFVVASTWLLCQCLQIVSLAQSVADVLALAAQDPATLQAVALGAAGLIPNVLEPYTASGTLPQCERSNVLLNSGGFPRDWGRLSADRQAAHPINLVMMQLAHVSYQTPGTFSGCLGPMGVDTNSIRPVQERVHDFHTTRSALVMKAGKERILVTIMGSDFRGLKDVSINLACKHIRVDGKVFGAQGKDIRIHSGFWSGWQALQQEVITTVLQQLRDVSSGEVYVIGHSLGAAMASLAALQLHAVLPKGRAQVAGVWLFGSPRVGNAEWSRVFNAALLSKTMRISNYQDFAATLPAPVQACSLNADASILTLEAYTANTSRYDYQHIGRQVMMCPNAKTGLTEWRINPAGSNKVGCVAGKGVQGSLSDSPDFSGGTHQLGSYFDAWRRGYFSYKQNNLATDPSVTAIMCQQCTVKSSTVLDQLNAPARAGGPVTCAVDASCNIWEAYAAAVAVGEGYSAKWGGKTSLCQAHICS